MSAQMTYWTLDPPKRWQAGTVGEAKTPFYFSCADCRAEDCVIHAILSTDGTFRGIGILTTDPPFGRPAMFCQPCYQARIEEDTAEVSDATRSNGPYHRRRRVGR